MSESLFHRSPHTKAAGKVLGVHIVGVIDDTAGTGGEDYAALLSIKQNVFGKGLIDSRFLSNCAAGTLSVPDNWRNFSNFNQDDRIQALQQELPDYLNRICLDNTYRKPPVLVVHLTTRGGALITPELMRRIPTVAVCHEFIESSEALKSVKVRQLVAASRVLFTAQDEANAAIARVRGVVGDRAAQALTRKSYVYPVPPSITRPEAMDTNTERDNSIVSFGMIKKGKNLETLPGIARDMAHDPYFQKRYIHIVGTVRAQIDEEQHGTLKALLTEVFGFEKEALRNVSGQETVILAECLESNSFLDASKMAPHLLDKLRGLVDPPPSRLLPIKFHINRSAREVAHILSKHRYFFSPMPRGATTHSSALASAIDWGMITFVCKNPHGQTPKMFGNGSIYLLDTPADLLEGIKTHEMKAQQLPSYEQEIIRKGKEIGRHRNWEHLAHLVTNMVMEASAESSHLEY